MDSDDPEQRIRELERQISEEKARGASASSAGSEPYAGAGPAPLGSSGPYGNPQPYGSFGMPLSNPVTAAPTGFRRSSRWGFVAFAIVPIVVALIPLGIWLFAGRDRSGSDSSHDNGGPNSSHVFSSTTSSAPAPPPDQLTLGGLSGLLTQVRTKFGDTMGYELIVQPEQAFIRVGTRLAQVAAAHPGDH
jgi:hypothetical protein